MAKNMACIKQKWDKKNQEYVPTLVFFNVGDRFSVVGDPDTYAHATAESMRRFIASLPNDEKMDRIMEMFDQHRAPVDGYGIESEVLSYDDNKKMVDKMFAMLSNKPKPVSE